MRSDRSTASVRSRSARALAGAAVLALTTPAASLAGEIVHGVELTGMSLPDYLRMLRDNGLDTLPGTAAEILDDDVRFLLSRNKLSTEQWKQVIRTAHGCGIRSTSTLMYGHVETPTHWVNQLLLFREIQQETGGFTEFVPLGFIFKSRG